MRPPLGVGAGRQQPHAGVQRRDALVLPFVALRSTSLRCAVVSRAPLDVQVGRPVQSVRATLPENVRSCRD